MGGAPPHSNDWLSADNAAGGTSRWPPESEQCLFKSPTVSVCHKVCHSAINLWTLRRKRRGIHLAAAAKFLCHEQEAFPAQVRPHIYFKLSIRSPFPAPLPTCRRRRPCALASPSAQPREGHYFDGLYLDKRLRIGQNLNGGGARIVQVRVR